MKLILTIACLLFLAEIANSKNYPEDSKVAWQTVFEVPTVSGNIRVDGKPDDSAWKKACSVNTFYNSTEAEPVPVDADIDIAFDGESLVFGINIPNINSGTNLKKCYLSDEPDLRRVPNISIYIDPTHNHGVYYRFIIDSNGNKQDLCVDDESWNAGWSAAVHKDNGRLEAEVKIPTGSLGEKISDGDVWGFNITFDGVSESGTLSSTPVKINLADADNFGHLLFDGRLGQSKLKKIKEALPGMHERQYEAKLAANESLCGPELAVINGELKNISVGKEITLKNNTGIKCIGLENEEIIRSRFPFFYEKYENEQLQNLRKQYNLDEVVAPGKNDFEKLLLLNEWLYTNVKFGSPPPIRPNGPEVLQYGLQGQTFNCTYLSFTLMQMYLSMGYTARKISGAGHGTLDVWSDYWQKWIQIDPSRHSYYRLKGKGVPLNTDEIRKEYWKNGGTDMEMVYGTDQRAERVTLETRDKDGLMLYRPDSYAWVAYQSRNNFFEVPFCYWNFNFLIIQDKYDEGMTWMNGDNTDSRELMGTRTSRAGDVFWTLNQAFIHLYDEGSNNLKVQLETVTPNFKTFEYSIDKGDWKNCEPVFYWQLHPGQNFLQARSVNKFGIKGHEYKMVLKVD